MFIADQGEPRCNPYPQRPYAQAQRPQRTLGPCFGCQGEHQWKDCPTNPANVVPNVPPNVSQTLGPNDRGHCSDCGKKHLYKDCPHHPDQKGKATINIIEVLPSTSGSESDAKVPLNVVTRAQARKEEAVNQMDIEKDVESSKSVKTKSAKRALRDRYRSQYHKKLKAVTAELSKAQEQLQQKPRDESTVKTDGIP